MTTVVLIHGISSYRPIGWWRSWWDLILPLFPQTSSLYAQPIEWETVSETSHNAVRLTSCLRTVPVAGRIYDLACDVSAVMDPFVQTEVRQRLDLATWLNPRVIVFAHSLGSRLAWQSLCALERDVRLLVTFGSPLWRRYLGIAPVAVKPAGVRRWVNAWSMRDWWVARRPIRAADRNVRCCCPHSSSEYLLATQFRRVLRAELAAAVVDPPNSPSAVALAA